MRFSPIAEFQPLHSSILPLLSSSDISVQDDSDSDVLGQVAPLQERDPARVKFLSSDERQIMAGLVEQSLSNVPEVLHNEAGDELINVPALKTHVNFCAQRDSHGVLCLEPAQLCSCAIQVADLTPRVIESARPCRPDDHAVVVLEEEFVRIVFRGQAALVEGVMYQLVCLVWSMR